jgi:hypothetical protein
VELAVPAIGFEVDPLKRHDAGEALKQVAWKDEDLGSRIVKGSDLLVSCVDTCRKNWATRFG